MDKKSRISFKETIKNILGGIAEGICGYSALRALNRRKLLIICYHRVLRTTDAHSVACRDMFTDLESFREQMRFIRTHYAPVSEQDILDDIQGIKQLPDFPVWVTFDDGYLDNYTLAYPVLKEFGIPATFFISTGLIDHEAEALYDLEHNQGIDALKAKCSFMNWEQIRELSREGFYIGGHSRSHRVLSVLRPGQVADEIASAKQVIEKNISKPVHSFAYPYGKRADFDVKVCFPVLRDNGYKMAVSTIGGNNDLAGRQHHFDLRRVGISFKEPFSFFKLKLVTGSAWQR